MKKTITVLKKFLSLLIVIIIATAFNACTKGDTGPVGPAGANGTNGNANVYAATYTVNTWTLYTDNTVYYADFSVSALDANAQSFGAVEVFISTNSGTDWVSLPWTTWGTTNYEMFYITETQLVEVDWRNISGSTISGSDPNTILGVTCKIKIVVIPPALMKSNVNTHNYAEIKAAYHLKD